MVLIKDENFRHPILIDVFKANSDKNNQYDLPVWFQGHLLLANFDYQKEATNLTTLGDAHGYQHIWKEAVGKAKNDNAHIDWFSNGKFYSMTSVVDPEDELIFARLGANDPEFNLRNDPTFIIRKKEKKQATFVSIIEPHGAYSTVTELAEHPFTSIENVRILQDNAQYSVIQFSSKSGKNWTLMLAHEDASESSQHQINVGNQKFEWTGVYQLKKML